jgi:hypothetical protein
MENKKIAAVSAAVFQYIKTEEEAAVQAAMQEEPAALSAGPEPVNGGPPFDFSSWRMAGRQAQMQQRAMMQMKAFH